MTQDELKHAVAREAIKYVEDDAVIGVGTGSTANFFIDELAKIKHPEVAVNVIHTGIGAITESDVMLASASDAIVAGFNVRPNAEARSLSGQNEGSPWRAIFSMMTATASFCCGSLAAPAASAFTARISSSSSGAGSHGRGHLIVAGLGDFMLSS